MKRIQATLCSVVVVSNLLYGGAANAQLDESDFAGAVTISSNTSQGSGFFIDATTVLTAAHVVSGVNDIRVLEAGSELNRSAEISSLNQDCDVAKLEVSGMADSVFEISSDPVQPGMTVFAVGSPIGRSVLSVGKIETANKLLIFTTVPVDFGSSGGPLLNSDRQVIGLVTKKGPTGNAIAVPIQKAIQCLSDAGNSSATQPLPIAPTDTQMYVTYLSFVVSIVALILAIIALIQARLKRRPIKITLPPTETIERL